ncbi:hypothetical protein [Streptomyces cyaneus]|uniref:hypothetical protein n=1 Tax=Streptomyces cyaneus TaxID=1904 RepID=UPI000FF8882D|nr:hypothetical protein [Streptomyces cyaneus]
MNVTKRTLAVIALAGAAVLSATTVASADTRDARETQPAQTSTNLVYPYSAAYPPGILPLAAAPAAALLFGVL